MRHIFLLFFLFSGMLNTTIFAQSCVTATSVPAGHKKLGSGSATAEYEGTTTIKGGQSAYVKIKNENLTGVSYILTIREDAKPEHTNCTYQAVLLPHMSVILYGALFAPTPIGWKVTVAVGPQSSAGVLTYEVYSATK